jgi:tetratricopeptide (TPR) repeat protein
MQEVLQVIAVLSSFRLVSPLCTVLRPVTGGVFDSRVSSTVKQLDGIVVWGDYLAELGDQALRFIHPAHADECLRQRGVKTFAQKLEAISSVLSSLSAGQMGDTWVAESLAATVLTPPFDERPYVDWECRLGAFEQMPAALRDQSKVILHHWARCLYLSADLRNSPYISSSERGSRLEAAISKIGKATTLARRGPRGEHPSHLYNTLGTAYVRYAAFLEAQGAGAEQCSAAWDDACRAFEQAIALSGGTNMDALLAFSSRLLNHTRAHPLEQPMSERQASDLAYALSLLDQAEELIEQSPSPDPDWEPTIAEYRAEALQSLNTTAAQSYIQELQRSINPELGYYCAARLALLNPNEVMGYTGALRLLEEAEQRGIRLGWRSLLLQLWIMHKYPPQRFEFRRLRELHERLEKDREYAPRPVDMFSHAVLCYPTGSYVEGAERFRKLREVFRGSGNAPLGARDFWREPSEPNKPRLTTLRLDRIVTEWRAEGYVDDLRQSVPLRPRHFAPLPKLRDVVECIIRFEPWGPLAVPPRFR